MLGTPIAHVLADNMGWTPENTAALQLLDVGCGSAVYGLVALTRLRHARLTAQDWPLILPVAQAHAARLGVAERLQPLAGDLRTIDFGGPYDVVFLGHILHNYDEETCRKIVRRCMGVLAPGGVIAVIEFLAERGQPASNICVALQYHDSRDHQWGTKLCGGRAAANAHRGRRGAHRSWRRAAGRIRPRISSLMDCPGYIRRSVSKHLIDKVGRFQCSSGTTAKSDVFSIVRLFYETIHTINSRDHSAAQLHAWAPEVPSAETWHSRMVQCCTLVAEENGAVIAFAELEPGDMAILRCSIATRTWSDRVLYYSFIRQSS